jgi:hypothetical protein
MESEDKERQGARERVFNQSRALAAALMDADAPVRYEPLRDLILSGLEAGGLLSASNIGGVRAGAGELASATIEARRDG